MAEHIEERVPTKGTTRGGELRDECIDDRATAG